MFGSIPKKVYDYAYVTRRDYDPINSHTDSKNKLIAAAGKLQKTFGVGITFSDNNFDLTPTNLNLKENKTSVLIKMYPNPTNGLFNVRFENDKLRNVTIFDIKGSEIHSVNYTSTDAVIDLSGKESGVYLVQVQSETGNWVGKIIIR